MVLEERGILGAILHIKHSRTLMPMDGCMDNNMFLVVQLHIETYHYIHIPDQKSNHHRVCTVE